MNMMVHVLASNDWCNGMGLLDTCFGAGVLELHTLFFETSLDGAGVTVLDLTLLDGGHSVGVFFGENLAILNWLDRGVVVVLMHLTINGGLGLLMTLPDDLLLHNGGCDLLVDCGVMVTSLLPIWGI